MLNKLVNKLKVFQKVFLINKDSKKYIEFNKHLFKNNNQKTNGTVLIFLLNVLSLKLYMPLPK